GPKIAKTARASFIVRPSPNSSTDAGMNTVAGTDRRACTTVTVGRYSAATVPSTIPSGTATATVTAIDSSHVQTVSSTWSWKSVLTSRSLTRAATVMGAGRDSRATSS